MQTAAKNIVSRFLARTVVADERWQPPRSVVNAVDEGKLDPHVLLFWKQVVEILLRTDAEKGKARKTSPEVYKAATAYWRNKCAKEGYPLPNEYLEGMGGEGSTGRWKVAPGDQIEEWVKMTLLSQKLVDTVEASTEDLVAEISYLQTMLEDASERVTKHEAGLSKAKSDKGVSQRMKWLAGAKADVIQFTKDLAQNKEKLQKLTETVKKKDNTAVYAIEFEKEFQFMMLVAQKDLDKKVVLDSVKKAIERFEAGLAIPDAESPAHDVGRYEGPSGKTAGVLDFLSGALTKAWEHLKGAFDFFTAWIDGIVGTTKKIDKLLTDAGA